MFEVLNLRSLSHIVNSANTCEGLATKTSEEQSDVERLVLKKYNDFHMKFKVKPELPELLREQHAQYLLDNLWYLSTNYECLDASRTWLCYWILHGLSLLEVTLDEASKSRVAQFLAKCQHPTGGFGGGPGQTAHLAATYAAVNALAIINTPESFKVINREKLLEFFYRVRQPDGSFIMHDEGEVDIRGVYCAISAASITGIMSEELFEGTAEWIASCQTYEGGFAGLPGLEAHGGYAFCGFAALVLLGKPRLCDRDSLLRWLVQRQMKLEGGFQGRTNKLVDGCYSFWQGASFHAIYYLLKAEGLPPVDHLFDERALQEYLLICCQHPSGGLLDKPGKNRDVFHTCYTLSGLSIAQHFMDDVKVLGPKTNKVAFTYPFYNIRQDLIGNAFNYFSKLGVPQLEKNRDKST